MPMVALPQFFVYASPAAIVGGRRPAYATRVDTWTRDTSRTLCNCSEELLFPV